VRKSCRDDIGLLEYNAHMPEREVTDPREQSPTIWRCSSCGGLIHPSDERTPVAWCSRCSRVTEGIRDGG